MEISCIIIEDEPLAMKKLEGYIEKTPFLKLVGKFKIAVDAICFIKENNPALLFLDIQMPVMTGIEFLQSLGSKPKVIITTAYQEYALKGYELQVCDYLLKPIQFDRFIQACQKAYDEIARQTTPGLGYIFVKTEYRLERIDTESILYIEGMRDYRNIVTTTKKVMTLQTFREFEGILSPEIFLRVHNSFIVSLDKIESIERNRIRIGKKLIPISDSKREEFYRKIQNGIV
jgi:two-component system, LytTR family, response regulator